MRPGGVLGRIWLRAALVFGLAVGVATPDAAARPQSRPTRAVAAKRGRAKVTKPPRSRPAPTRGKATARKPAPRAPAAAMVMVHGALRSPGAAPGRVGGELTREEAAAEALEKILRGPLRFGTTGLYVVDAQTGRELFAVHPDDPLNPASNVKLISTATALDLLGPDFRYTTRLLGPTPADGVIAGDVYLLGTYDPTLVRADVVELARSLAAAGVRRIDGDVVVGGTATRDGIYRPNIRVDVTAGAPGEAPTVTVAPAYDFVEVTTTATSGKRPKVKGRLAVDAKLVTHDDGTVRMAVTVAGAIGKGKTVTRWLSTKERHLHTAHVLRAALREAGVELGGDVAVRELPDYVDAVAAGGRLPVTLAEHRSAPLGQIIAKVNKRSINWLSDRVVATATALTRAEKPSMGRGVDAMYGWLERAAGIRRDQLVVDTGSGLSYRTQFSPRQIVSVVRAAAGLTATGHDDPRTAACAEAWRTSLSVSGVDGTLRRRFKGSDLRGRIHGKTGTLSRAIALSGLLEGPDGRTLAFALVTNGHAPARKNLVRGAHEQVLEVLDAYLAAAPLNVSDAVPDSAADAAAEIDLDSELEAASDAEGSDELGDETTPDAPAVGGGDGGGGDGGDGPVTQPAP